MNGGVRGEPLALIRAPVALASGEVTRGRCALAL